ncbi:SRPBCC domain-containing protein, partial [Spirillospora sp. NPDC000708]
MKLENAFTIPVPADEAWRVLLDIERIAPCVPGATLTSRDGDRFDGKVKVRLGPIALTYSGSVAFVSLDEDAGVALVDRRVHLLEERDGLQVLAAAVDVRR